MHIGVTVQEVLGLERDGRAAWVDAFEGVGSRCPVVIGVG